MEHTSRGADAGSEETTSSMTGISRRKAVAGVGVVAVSGVALAACAVDDGSDGGQDGAGNGDQNDESNGGTENGSPLAQTSDIPVGGGAVYDDAEVVITQPEEGTFRGFSAICKHQGCTVGEVANETINCPCHGSRYAIADGAVVEGPAEEALDGRELSIDGEEIRLA